jgi:hypothetical protein
MVYSSVGYCPNVVVSWRSGVRRRGLVFGVRGVARCEGCCSV